MDGFRFGGKRGPSGAYAIEKARASGASAAAIVAKAEEMKKAKAMYNVALTFLEPFPVGLVMTLISAALLRRCGAVQAPGAVVSDAV